jgi:phospholipid/cholesterol/gamma-HCH transport system substrate-binding protein
MFVDTSYTVVAHFEDSGGIFAGAEVSYRGVRVGQVEKLELTDAGVDVYIDIDNAYDDIPADAQALVGNRSAGGGAVRRAPAAVRRRAVPEGRLADRDGRHPDADPDPEAVG